MPLDFPTSPINGQVYDNFYYDSSISAWRNNGSKNGLSTRLAAEETLNAGPNKSGLVPVIPTSVTVASGSSSVASDGTVTVTGSSATVLNGVFANYDAYHVNVFEYRQSTAGVVYMQLAQSGTRRTTTTYHYGSHYAANSGGSGVLTSNAGTAWDVARSGTSTSNQTAGSWDIFDPNKTSRTKMVGNSFGDDGSSYIGITARGLQVSDESFDGLAFVPSAGNATFKIKVYGYRN